jgi:DNA-binding transcriptional LysR family regulator
LTAQRCINQRMPTSGGLYVWDFARRGKAVKVRVDGPLIFNTSPPQVDAAVAGLGLALLPEDAVAAPLAAVRRLPPQLPVLVVKALRHDLRHSH